jgi:hypothetical protein
MGAWVDTWWVMYDPSREAEPAVSSPPKRMLAMAILAPFGVIALLASPLVLDALRQAAGA